MLPFGVRDVDVGFVVRILPGIARKSGERDQPAVRRPGRVGVVLRIADPEHVPAGVRCADAADVDRLARVVGDRIGQKRPGSLGPALGAGRCDADCD